MTLCRRDFNTADQAFLHNPYPRYALWRQEQPVFWSEGKRIGAISTTMAS
jgi:hypothetical protein